jgi:acyl-CoA thioesterase-1
MVHVPSYGRRAALIQMATGFLGVAAALSLPAVARAADPVRLVALGDSLTAGYQLPPAAAFPVQLERALTARGLAVSVENAGVSGDTASGGLARLDWAIGDGVKGVLLELGANDALRGVPPAETRAALDAIITRLKERGIAVLLIGMRAPPNMGAEYQAAFDAIYPDLAAKHGVPLYPFFLDGVVADPSLNLPDGMHPTEKGVAVIVERILPVVEKFIASL